MSTTSSISIDELFGDIKTALTNCCVSRNQEKKKQKNYSSTIYILFIKKVDFNNINIIKI